jgi:hypothetical protein
MILVASAQPGTIMIRVDEEIIHTKALIVDLGAPILGRR